MDELFSDLVKYDDISIDNLFSDEDSDEEDLDEEDLEDENSEEDAVDADVDDDEDDDEDDSNLPYLVKFNVTITREKFAYKGDEKIILTESFDRNCKVELSKEEFVTLCSILENYEDLPNLGEVDELEEVCSRIFENFYGEVQIIDEDKPIDYFLNIHYPSQDDIVDAYMVRKSPD